MEMFLTALGGVVGVLCRYAMTHLGWFDENKYYYTVAINLTGCFIIGVIWSLFRHYDVSRLAYFFVITGALGGYTTFSSFSLDAIQLIEAKMELRALWYISITLIGGLGACALGLTGTDKLLRLIG